MRSQEASGLQIQNSQPDFRCFLAKDKLKSKDVPEAVALHQNPVESQKVRGDLRQRMANWQQSDFSASRAERATGVAGQAHRQLTRKPMDVACS